MDPRARDRRAGRPALLRLAGARARVISARSADGIALAVRGVGVSFGGLRALDDVTIEVPERAIVGIIGPNGAGKTTLFDAIGGFIPCDGSVFVGGRDVSGAPPHARAAAGLGRSFQDARLFTSMTVLDTVRVASELRMQQAGVIGTVLALPGARAAERRATERALALIDLFGLGAFRDKLIRELSTGTRRIVDLACVMAQEPSVVMLDEPSSGIAQREAEALAPLLRRVRDRTGCALVLIEHDMPLLMGLAEHVTALETGRVIAAGAPDEVVHHPEVIRSYLGGDPAAIARSGSRPPAAPRARRAPTKGTKKATAKKATAKKATAKRAAPKRGSKPAKKAGRARPRGGTT